MMWHFDTKYAGPRYWIDEIKAKQILRRKRKTEKLSCENYRLVFRRQASSTNERTFISTIVAPCIHDDNLASFERYDADEKVLMNASQLVYANALLSSFTLDYNIRSRVTTNLNFFFIEQTPLPRLDSDHPTFNRLVQRAARLICTTPEFDALAQEVGLAGHEDGATNDTERARLRAEIDGLVAHLYGLSEEEFIHILATFPLVKDPIKVAARNAYRDVERGLLQD